MALIGEDCAITIAFGTRNAATGAITYNAAGSIKGIAKRVSVEDKLTKVDTSAMGDARHKYRGAKGESTVKIDTITQTTGWAFTASNSSPIGQPVQVTIKALSSFSSGAVYSGLVETWEINIADSEAQMENITISCDADGS